MKNILFVCTGNSCRSVMAEGLFRKMTQSQDNEFIVGSAGIAALDGHFATQDTIEAMEAQGIDVSTHRSRRLTPGLIRWADYIFVMDRSHKDWILRMEPEAKDKVSLLTQYSPRAHERNEEVGIPDPIHMPLPFYNNVLRMIRECLEGLLKTL